MSIGAIDLPVPRRGKVFKPWTRKTALAIPPKYVSRWTWKFLRYAWLRPGERPHHGYERLCYRLYYRTSRMDVRYEDLVFLEWVADELAGMNRESAAEQLTDLKNRLQDDVWGIEQ